MGYTAAAKVPERWIPTTCGYCSVGCGMFIGVKNGRAVSVRGNPDHPVHRGALCPKGLSEHETIHAPPRQGSAPPRPPPSTGRAGSMERDRRRRPERVGWNAALETMAGRFRE